MHLLSLNKSVEQNFMVGLILHACETNRIIYCAWDKTREDKAVQDA